MLDVYNLLNKEFGKQGWWPIDLKHHNGRPKSEKHRFEIVIGAVLTQNTNWKNVEKALTNLDKEGLIDLYKIAKVDVKKLGDLIRPAGYYNQKAERLKGIADYILNNYWVVNDFLSFKIIDNKKIKKNVSELREELLSLKGIGPETADSIILYAAEKPIFVIDAYTKRLYSRLFGQEKGYDELQEIFMDSLKKDVELFKEYHALIVELGKRNCKTKPDCSGCCLKAKCKLV